MADDTAEEPSSEQAGTAGAEDPSEGQTPGGIVHQTSGIRYLLDGMLEKVSDAFSRHQPRGTPRPSHTSDTSGDPDEYDEHDRNDRDLPGANNHSEGTRHVAQPQDSRAAHALPATFQPFLQHNTCTLCPLHCCQQAVAQLIPPVLAYAFHIRGMPKGTCLSCFYAIVLYLCCSQPSGTPGKARSSLGDGDSENFSFPVTPPSEPAPAGPVFGHGFGRASSGVSHGVRASTGIVAGACMLYHLRAAHLGVLNPMLHAHALMLWCNGLHAPLLQSMQPCRPYQQPQYLLLAHFPALDSHCNMPDFVTSTIL